MVEKHAPKSEFDKNDILLFVAIVASMSAGVLVPSVGRIFQPYLLVWLGGLLFLNLIRMDLGELASTFKAPKTLAILSITKLLVLPLLMYAITKIVYEPLAIPVLLLSGVSTGLGAPFVINVTLEGEKNKRQLSLVVAMVIVTSLAVPFVLPAIVYSLLGNSQFKIPILQMIFMLVTALFTPIAAGWFVKKRWPTVAKKVDKRSLPASIIFIALINFGIFAEFSNYFFKKPEFLFVEITASFILFAAYSAIGYFTGRIASGKKGNRKELIATGIVVMSYVNNVLVVVFASQFFGPDYAALAAFYNLPYYGLILLLKKLIIAEQQAKSVS
jgi:BASS family bile acid:Na+ symporter